MLFDITQYMNPFMPICASCLGISQPHHLIHHAPFHTSTERCLRGHQSLAMTQVHV